MQYLLNEKEITTLCCLVTIGGGEGRNRPLETTILASRKQVEAAALSKYPNGHEGLLADKREREIKARTRYEARMADYHTKLTAFKANPVGKPPSHPRPSKLVDNPINAGDGGFMIDLYKNFSLCQIGFPSKLSGLPGGDGVIYCRQCVEAGGENVKVGT